MNKLQIFAILALAVVGAIAQEDEMSQIALATTDDIEKSGLEGDMKAFDDFCISSRDHIFMDIKNTANGASSKVFALLFDSAEAIGQGAVDTVRVGNDRLSKQIASPDTPIEPASNEIEEMIVDGQQKVNVAQTQPFSFLEAFKSIISATSAAVGNMVRQRVNEIVKQASIVQVITSLQTACDKVKSYESDLREQFDSYKSQLNKPEFESVTMDKVNCVTSRRVVRISALCEFARSAQPSLGKLLATRN